MTQQEKAEILLFSLAGMSVNEKLDDLAHRIAEKENSGKTYLSILDEYCDITDVEDTLRTMALRIVGTTP